MRYISKKKYKKLVNLVEKRINANEEYDIALEYFVVDIILERLHIKVEEPK